MLRLLPVIGLIFLALIIGVLSNSTLKREIVYKLGISGDNTSSCCDVNEILSQDGSFDESANLAQFNSETVDYPKTSLAQYMNAGNPDSAVLGTTNSAGEEKWVEVSLAQQILRAWEGNRIVKEYPISSGKWAATPKGTFYIWYKTRYQTMKGGSKALRTYYYLPNVPHNMFFKGGYAIHGAYWHNNFGNPMSHGCVNEPLDKAAELFDWAGPVVPDGKNVIKASADNPGTKVFIH